MPTRAASTARGDLAARSPSARTAHPPPPPPPPPPPASVTVEAGHQYRIVEEQPSPPFTSERGTQAWHPPSSPTPPVRGGPGAAGGPPPAAAPAAVARAAAAGPLRGAVLPFGALRVIGAA